jgi:LmbE family N-acetylglucosaminyl deacetylase
MKKFCATVTLILLIFQLQAQTMQQPNAAAIKHQLKKLGVVGSVLYIAAHPDDENTRLISFLTNEQLYRTGYLSLTRGDGGQNLIGNEQAEQLGVIRTQELLAARRIDGGEQYFTRANDFGYSKTAEETFKIWNKDSLLHDVVWVIRNFKPDVIICRFPTTGEGGHGHHTASAILAEEAFKAAADPKMFPQQLQHTEVWQAKRLLWNTFNFGNRNTTDETQFKIDVGGFDVLLGKSYGEIAAESRSQHSSQAFGTARNRASQLEYFKTILGDAPKNNLLDGVDISWLRFSKGNYFQNAIQQLIKNFDFENPSNSVYNLMALYDELKTNNDIDAVWKKVKLKEIEKLITACSGLWAEALSKQQITTNGDSVEINLLAVNRSDVTIQLNKILVNGEAFVFNKEMNKGALLNENKKIVIAEKQHNSQPYWLKKEHGIGLFEVNDLLEIGNAENTPPLNATFNFSIAGKEIEITLPVQYKIVDPAKGEIYQPFYVAPAVTATIQNEVFVFSGTESKTVQVKLKTFQQNAKGTVSLAVPKGWKATPASINFSLVEAGNEQMVQFTVSAESNTNTSVSTLKAVVTIEGKNSSYSYVDIKYDHIPQQILFPEASAQLVKIDLKRNKKLIGYLAGAGDKIPDALKQIGYIVKEITEDEILNNRLQPYEAIITGVRAYNTETKLKNWQPFLMKYVEQGGTLVVQYNTSQKLVTENLGPYPFKLSRDRVTEEDAAVTLLNAQHRALTFPNKITTKDFDGWIQERGLYFPSDVDAKYTKLFSMNDTGEKPLDNSTIYAEYGKGKFIYTGLSFFRELPAGVPGAYRLLVNFLEL